jgi:hypothetical protein
MTLRKSALVGLGIVMLAALALGLWGDARVSAGRSQNGFRGLFVDSPVQAAADRGQDRTTIRSRRVTIDRAAIAEPGITDARMAAHPTLLLNLFDDTSFAAVLDRVDVTATGWTWVGHVSGLRMSTVTLATVGGVMVGNVVMPEAVYDIRYLGNDVNEVTQVDQSKFLSELDPIEVTPSDITATSSDATTPVAMGDDGSTIDVLVLYTPAAVTAAGGTTAAMQALIELGRSNTNTSYLNSGIAQRLNVVATQELNYTENNDLGYDLDAVTNYNGATTIGNTAASLRNTYGADLVMLITSPPNANGCGIAWMMGSVSSGFSSYGFSVVERSCISGNYTFAHELGHNMGARHDWYVDANKTPYVYSHGYVDVPNKFRTVMSYANLCSDQGITCRRLLYWSNPNTVAPSGYGNAPMGIAGGTKSDCTTGSTTNALCDADDHSALNNTAYTVANFRQAVAQKITPTITWATPASVAVWTALSSTQLNASSGGIAGTFVYSPSVGAVMSTAGNQTLTATFTPTNTSTYATATASVTLLVTAGGSSGGFIGPSGGGGYTGTISGSNLIYRGTSYPITGGRVYFPDCTNYAVIPGGYLMMPQLTANCTPGSGGGGGGTTPTTPTITWVTPSSITAGTALSGTQLNASSGGVAGAFTYSPSAGTVMSTAGNQTLSVTFTPTDTTTYTTATATVTLVVTANGFMGPSSGGGYTGTVSGSTLTYRSTAYPISGGRVYFPDCTNYMVAPNGALMFGQTTANCSPGGGSTKTTPTISWTAPTSVTVGTALSGTQLNASSGGVAGSFSYVPPSGTVMSTAGSQTLSVTFTPTDTATYNTATASVTLVVSSNGGGGGGGGGTFFGPNSGGGYRGTINGSSFSYNGTSYTISNGRVFFPDCTDWAVVPGGFLMMGAATAGCTPGGGTSQTTPTITWQTPASVTVGTALSGTQLNATSGGVAGTFTYNPPAGTVMSTAGSPTLSVTFTPIDTTTYTTATASVTLVVATSGGGGGGGGGSFVGPSSGGGYNGSTSGSNFVYRGTSYPITSGRVYFPDCTNYAIIAGAYLMMGAATPNCTPGGGGGGGSQTTPTITWATPASVTVGTVLSGTQLNASSGGVAGTFTYNPLAGTLMNIAGSHTLSVAFTPTDTTTYTTATASVTLTVSSSGGSGFVGPSSGGGYNGTVSGSMLTYRGAAYPLTNGRVYFPDCTNYMVAPNGVLMIGQTTPNCTPSDR